VRWTGEPDRASFWHVSIRKVEVRSPRETVLSPVGLASHRQDTVDAIRAYKGEGRPARRWPIQFLIRRIARHCTDHAWEMEDRDLSG